MEIKLLRAVIAVLLCGTLLAACGSGGGGGGGDTTTTGGGGNNSGGGGGTTGGTTTFSGGTLDDLKALSPTLTFDNLQITGALSLPLYSSTTITANKITITSTGSIVYSYTTCQYADAPGITLNVSGDVLIEGSITLNGRSGTTVTETASCNSCYGQDGGNITITGNTITVTGAIWNYGGGGASIHWSMGGSSPCSAGGSGNLKLAAAATMDLSGADINNQAGQNFENTQGTSGTAIITAGGAFTMKNGSIQSTGAMTFTAGSTDIWGVITYGTLNETIGGSPDTAKPVVTILSPQPNVSVPWHQPLEIKVQASDSGMGLKSVQVKGLGQDKTYQLSDFVASTLTTSIGSPDLPETLEVIATDNKGNVNTVSVTGLKLQYPAEVEPNNSMATAQSLELGGIIQGNIVNGDAGYTWTSGVPTDLNPNKSFVYKIEDFYKVTCCKTWQCQNWLGMDVTCYGITVSLDFSGSSAAKPDLDFFLINAEGTSVIGSSLNDNIALNNYTETISRNFTSTDMGKIFYLGVQAWDVPTGVSYMIKYE